MDYLEEDLRKLKRIREIEECCESSLISCNTDVSIGCMSESC